MANDDAGDTTLTEFQVDPSPRLWCTEIHRVVQGAREQAMENLGSAADYVEHLVAQCEDRSLSRRCFLDGLKEFVQTWNPSHVLDAHGVGYVLDLLERYTPQDGDLKLKKLFTIEQLLDRTSHALPGLDLRMKALHALASYFPASPIGNPDSFLEYLDILRQHTQHDRCARYALRTLLKHYASSGLREPLAKVLPRAPDLVDGVVHSLLASGGETRLGESLTVLYEACLMAGEHHEAEFREAVKKFPATFEFVRTGGPLVSWPTPTGERELVLSISDELSGQYADVYYKQRCSRGKSSVALREAVEHAARSSQETHPARRVSEE